MADGMNVQMHAIEVDYMDDEVPVVVDGEVIDRIRRHRFRFRAGEPFLRSCLAYGATAVAVGATIYFLKDKFSLSAIPIASNSAIFDVIVPEKAGKEFENLIEQKTIQKGLQEVFLDIENHLRGILGDDFGVDVTSITLKELKNIRIGTVKLCDEETVEKALVADEVNKNRVPLEPPSNARVTKNEQSPDTSILVFFERQKTSGIGYIVTVKDLLEKEEIHQVETTEDYALVRGLTPGQSYLVYAQSVRDGVRSQKVILGDPIRTAQFNPFPWRLWDSSTVVDSGRGTSISGQTGTTEAQEDDLADRPDMWDSDLHITLQKILRIRFPEAKMKRLLFKCDEIGIVEGKDLKYLETKEIADELKETIKPVEILKLMDYAKDQNRATTQSEGPQGLGGTGLMISTGAQSEIRIADSVLNAR